MHKQSRRSFRLDTELGLGRRRSAHTVSRRQPVAPPRSGGVKVSPLLMAAPPDPERRPPPDNRLRAIHRLRYEVYCLERKFRDATECPDGLERDEYDAHSIHVYATAPTGAGAA